MEDQLAAAGLLTVKEPRTRFGTRHLTVTDPAALRARVSAALHGDGPVREIPADAALLALAAAGGIRSVLSRQDHKTLRPRIDACTGRLDALAHGLGKAVRALPMTMIAAQGGMGAADRDDVTELMSMHRALTTLGCALTAVFAPPHGPGHGTRPGPRTPPRSRPVRSPAAVPARTAST
ncbi:hypothetical protein SSPO_004080 [Streptomyces antimycoticus]|uniref:Uncharacterized protein n=1 Tax=Streptomyces antimycoticus TaxID=68175 RepID=A0A499UD55_9ACTN|nr:hypothetical protein SSPO_004080 [Streptomyces antimycoticus]